MAMTPTMAWGQGDDGMLIDGHYGLSEAHDGCPAQGDAMHRAIDAHAGMDMEMSAVHADGEDDGGMPYMSLHPADDVAIC